MKKLKLFQAVICSIVLLSVFLFKSPNQVMAQGKDYYHSPVSNTLFGTSDSRLTATVKQVGNHVTMTVGAVGTVTADVFEFNVLFDSDELKVTDEFFNPILDKGTAQLNPSILGAVRLEQALRDMDFDVSSSTEIKDDGPILFGGTGYNKMYAIAAHVQNVRVSGNTKIAISDSVFVPLYTIFFEKTNADPLTPNAIGFNIRVSTGLVQAVRWVYEGGSVSYNKTLGTGVPTINPDLFSFRSPSSVQTKTVTGIAENLAVFNGTFKRGELPPAYNLVDSLGTTTKNTGKLLNDSIVRYGFFYTESNIDITFTEYSNLLTIGGINYPFPTDAMIAQGYFMAGADRIEIVEKGTASSTQTQDYSDTVKGLKSNSTYYMWAFAQYVFETSKAYPIVGAKQTFTTSQMLNIVNIFAAKDPTCGNTDGEIQIHVTGGSGSFEYSLNGKDYKAYVNGLIDNLAAGSYRVYVRDAADTLYPAAVSAEIILRNPTSDLFVNTAVTNSSTCSAENGILHVSAGGGVMPYTYFLNGKQETPNNGQIADLKAGIYVLNVTDDMGCTVSSGEVRIGTNNSQFNLAVGTVVNAQCNESTGSIEFTVTGSDYYRYQLDGMSILTATNNNPILLTGLNAGVHTLRVFDTCGGEFTDTVIIYNHDINGFAVKHVVENVKVACNGSVTKGSITLTAENGMPNFKYTIDGTNWTYFPSGTNMVTIGNLIEGVYYVQIVDTNGAGCTYEINSIVVKRETAAPLSILTSYAVTEPSCRGNEGEIQIYATGGSGTYEYSVNGDQFKSYADGIINQLHAGTYTIEIRDANDVNCAAAQSEAIVLHSANNDLNLSVTPVDASTCASTGDGELHVSTSGGNGSYTYTWKDGTTATVVDGKIENLAAGVYVLNVTDGTCTTSSGEVRIFSTTSNLTVAVIDSTTTICGSSIGTATFKVTGSTNYSYQLNGMPIVSVNHNNPILLNNLSAGVHTLRVFNDCAETVRQIVISNGKTGGFAFAIKVENVKVTCDNSLIDGKILITAVNGVQDYICYINGVKQDFATGKDTLTLFVTQGVHHVRVEDNTGCSYEWNTITVGREKLPLINVGTIFASSDPNCNTDGEIQFYVSGGSGKYEYKYSKDGGSLSNAFNYTNGIISNLTAGNYKVSVWDANYPTCQAAVSTNVSLINSGSNFAVSLTADSASDCVTSNGTLYVSVNGGTGPYDYKLNGIVEQPINGTYTKPAGVYTVQVIDNGNNGCSAGSEEVRIYSKTSTLAVAINNTTPTTCNASIGAVEFTVSGSSNYTYQLNGMPAVQATANTPIVLNDLAAGVHTLRVFDNCGEVSKQVIITNGVGNLAFTAEVDNLGCSENKNIVLTISDGTAPYQFSMDNGNTWSTATNSPEIVISNVAVGNYNIIVRDDENCEYQYTQLSVKAGGLIAAPSALTPQTFCSGATVANLQAKGTDVKWYLSPNSGIALSPSQQLTSGGIYYAAQTIGKCESQIRTAVKVVINNEVMLDAPSIVFSQSFCDNSALTLADIATNGNTNIVWYAQAVGGSELPLSTYLTDGTSYFAAQAAGSCQSAVRAEVQVSFGSTSPDSVKIASPQSFCEGALIANIAVPHNQIVWYTEKTNGELLTQETVLRDGETYYAAHKAGSCESVKRTPVLVHFATPKAPSIPSPQTTCGGKSVLADLMATGSGIVWYDSPNSTTPLNPNTTLVLGSTYYAAQSSVNCEGDRAAVTITDVCFTLKGTVFPFVFTEDPSFDDLFPISVKLFSYPNAIDCNDPLTDILNQTPVFATFATHHDGMEWIPNTPKYPGVVGSYDNPGLPIDWAKINKAGSAPNYQLLVQGVDTVPTITSPGANIGKYALKDIAPAKYLMVISRPGFMTRIAEIQVTDDGYLGHRELVPGDVDDDFVISPSDASAVKARFASIGDPNYVPRYDLKGKGEVTSEDLDVAKSNNTATFMIYRETYNWIIKECK